MKSTKKIAVGVDENGYGPVMGPLVVTAVRVQVSGVESDEHALEYLSSFSEVHDSKYVFSNHRSGRKQAALLTSLITGNLKNLKIHPSLSLASCARPEKVFCASTREILDGLKREISALSDGSLFRLEGVRVLSVDVRVVCPRDFNAGVDKRRKTEFLLDEIISLLKATDPGTWDFAVIDSISGTKNYSKVFPDRIISMRRVNDSLYRTLLRVKGIQNVTAYFSPKGDEKFLPVSLASIVGKLVREIAMDFFNDALEKCGWNGSRVSGYRDSLSGTALNFLREKAFSRKCLFRRR